MSVDRLRKVEITDLLRRAPGDDESGAAAYVKGKVVLVTGAGGSIGSELCRQVVACAAHRNSCCSGTARTASSTASCDFGEQFPDAKLTPVIADIRDRDRIMRLFERFRPAVVFHAAAHKHVR